jgi:curved DNA-binding protein CbpA
MYDKDYYRILGVIDSAEDIVIRAAYKALAQRYHPDKFEGDPQQAKHFMQEINEAYSVLSDLEQKRQYDAWYSEQRRKEEYQADEDDELSDAMKADDKDWKLACDIYPELEAEFARLNRIASRLAMTFKILMLESKQFPSSKGIAERMEDDFFKTYFGSNPMLLSFAKEVVFSGDKKAAKKLNEYIRVLGTNIDPRRLIDKVCDTCGVFNHHKAQAEAEEREKREAQEKAEAAEHALKTLTNLTTGHFKCANCNYYGPVERYKAKLLKGETTGYKCPICGATDNVILK